MKKPYIEVRNNQDIGGSKPTYQAILQGPEAHKVLHESGKLNDCKIIAVRYRKLTGFRIIYTEARVVITALPEIESHD